jgi:DNA segregation ATPase FtsK/SpoIIIE-like protein
MHSNIERPSLDYLNDSTINEDSKNKVDVENSQLEIDAILHSYGINFSNSKVNIMPLFSQIIYTIEDESLVEKIFRLKNEIIKKINFDNINISSKGTKVFFDLPNRFKTSISIKKALTASKVNFVGKILLGTDIDHDTIFIDTKKYKNAIIFGKIGSGSSMLLSSMIISTLYTNKPSELECIILSASSNGKTINDMFSDLPHEIYKPSLGVDACIAMIHKILAELQYKKEKMLIVIDDFDLIIKQSIHNRELIIKLLTECKQQGSFVILSSKTVSNNSASNDILNLIDIKIILQLASETESINIINSLQAVQLFGKGDGYVLFENKNKTRFQSCYTNAQEIKAYSEIIINFYKNYKLFKNEH